MTVNSYHLDFPTTIYGGEAVYNGDGTWTVTVTHANIASYNGESINEPWISSMDAYEAGATPTTGAQVVYPLATPLTYTLTTEELTTLLQNNVWCDAGEISELKYYDGDIADTDIQTENGVLVTGDKLFYTLSSPRTSSFTPTAVNAVQGENTMSANTGNIAVTYTTNWHDITPWIAWQGISFSRNDVDAPDAGRDMSGLMHRGRVSVKEKININTIPLTRAQSAELQTLLYPETYQVRITPYPRTNAQQVLSVYSNNVKTSYVIHRESGEDLQTVSFPMIEN